MQDNSAYGVLVVDDSGVDAKVVAHALQRAGYPVTAITQAREALGLLESGDYALCLLDVNMPGMPGIDGQAGAGGFELLQEIRRRPHLRDLVIIMMSSDAAEKRIVRSIELGASDFILKPMSHAVIQSRVASSLAQQRMRSAGSSGSLRRGAGSSGSVPAAGSGLGSGGSGSGSSSGSSGSSSGSSSFDRDSHLLKVLVIDDSPTVLKFLG